MMNVGKRWKLTRCNQRCRYVVISRRQHAVGVSKGSSVLDSASPRWRAWHRYGKSNASAGGKGKWPQGSSLHREEEFDRRESRPMIKKILFPVDFSPSCTALAP